MAGDLSVIFLEGIGSTVVDVLCLSFFYRIPATFMRLEQPGSIFARN